MKLEIAPTLDYGSFSREAAAEALKANGVVSVALNEKQCECAMELVEGYELFKDAVRNRSSNFSVGRLGAKVLWATVRLAVRHGKLAGLLAFIVLDKPHAWNKENNGSGRVCLQFLGQRR